MFLSELRSRYCEFKIDTALTYLELEMGLFEVVIVAIQPKIEDYIQLATKMAKEQTEYLLIH